jgi:integrase
MATPSLSMYLVDHLFLSGEGYRKLPDCIPRCSPSLRLGTQGIRFHDLRRSFSTLLNNRGVALTKIQMLLGHWSVLITKRYLGVKFEETRTTIEVLDTPEIKALAGPSVRTIPGVSFRREFSTGVPSANLKH